jgi:hypothetical protein
MKRSYFLLFTVYSLLFSVLLCGCGSGPGSPGSSGSEDTGIAIKAVSIARTDGPDLDVYSDPTGCDGEPETLLTRKDATISIEASKLNATSTFDPFPASVEECKITYRKASEDPSSPTIEDWTFYPNCSLISGTNICNIQLIDITRLMAYWDALTGGINEPAEYPTHYIASYKCKYMNNYGDSGTFETEYDIWLADFLMCGG